MPIAFTSRFPELASLEKVIGHAFRHPDLLDRALTHSSQAREMEALHGASPARVGDNEQLEFLGDAVLGLVTTEELFTRFPQFSEGQLSKLRAHLVSKNHLIRVAEQLELGRYLRLGRGEEKTGGREKPALLADAFEAIVAAMYLDGGLVPVRNLLTRTVFEQALEDGERISESDRKSALQEFLQARGEQTAEYRLAGETGPDHQKTFRVEVWVKGECMSSAEGTTKKEAEQKAARSALEKLQLTEAKLGEEVGPNAG